MANSALEFALECDALRACHRPDRASASLQERGFVAQVVQVKRSDWLQALRGLFTRQYWQQKCQPAASYGWYLARVQQAVNKAREQTGHTQAGIANAAHR